MPYSLLLTPQKIMANARLPKFHKPPVVEAFCGISFQELHDLHAPQLGSLWSKFRNTYPLIETQPPLMNPPPGGSAVIFAPTQFRSWFLTADKTILVQVQRDRLIVNWRKQETALYPSFNVLNEHFSEVLGNFVGFIRELEIGELRFTGLEFGYVNIIPLDAPVSLTQDVTDIFPIFSPPQQDVFQSLSALNFQAQFGLPEKGHLNVGIQNTQSPVDGSPIFRCDLVSRWASPHIAESEVAPWLNMAHEVTVKAFASITSDHMHQVWERYQ